MRFNPVHVFKPTGAAAKRNLVVEGTSAITGPKCNKGPICNDIWTQA